MLIKAADGNSMCAYLTTPLPKKQRHGNETKVVAASRMGMQSIFVKVSSLNKR